MGRGMKVWVPKAMVQHYCLFLEKNAAPFSCVAKWGEALLYCKFKKACVLKEHHLTYTVILQLFENQTYVCMTFLTENDLTNKIPKLHKAVNCHVYSADR